MIQNTCPNCSAKLERASNKKKMVCPYCGSEFALEPEEKDTFDSDNLINKDWFYYDWDYEKIMSKHKELNTTVTAFIRYLNEYDSSEKLEEYIHNYLLSSSDVSAPGIREDKMTGIKAKIASHIEPGERITLYHDDGIFIHGKTGIVLTNKRAIYIESKNIKTVEYTKIPFFYFGYSMGLPEFKLGERYANNVPRPVHTSYDVTGALGALICFFSFENDPNRPKIKLESF